jgi:hypothetical protein
VTGRVRLTGRPFDGAVSAGLLAPGVAFTEVAAVEMVALASGRAALALSELSDARRQAADDQHVAASADNEAR